MSARWHALAVHTRSETAAAASLSTAGHEVFLPVRCERRAWSDRIARVELPLFAGYLFVRVLLSAQVRVDLLRCKHVVDVLGRLPGDARIARAIADVEIESLQVLVRADCALDPISRMVRGSHVRVVRGPLRGAEGVVDTAADGQRRLVVQLALLGRGVRAVLCADDVLQAVDSACAQRAVV